MSPQCLYLLRLLTEVSIVLCEKLIVHVELLFEVRIVVASFKIVKMAKGPLEKDALGK